MDRPISQPHGGYRPDLGFYVRSSWEANIARLLRYLQEKGEVLKWDYEPVEFWFPVKRGTRSFKPDFRVIFKDGTEEFWEITGYETDKKRVALARMREFYPNIKLRVITARNYKKLESQFARLIANWEPS